MNARWQDTPAAVFLRLLADLLTANVLMIICSVPLFTIGASLSAAYAVFLKRERDEGMVGVIRTFLLAFRDNFLQATALELVVVLVFAFAAGDFWFAGQSSGLIRTGYTAVGTVVALIGVLLFLLTFAQQSTYRNTVAGYLKNSLVLAVCAPGQVLLSLAAWIVPWYLGFAIPEIIQRFGVIYMICGFSFPVWATAKLMYRVFGKTGQKES